MEVLQVHVTGGKKSSSLRMLEAFAMAVWSATIGFFRLSVSCVPFVGFQVSTEDATSSTISATTHERFGCQNEEFLWDFVLDSPGEDCNCQGCNQGLFLKRHFNDHAVRFRPVFCKEWRVEMQLPKLWLNFHLVTVGL